MLEFHSFTKLRLEMNIHLDSWLDTNLRQFSKRNIYISVRVIVESGARETFKMDSNYLPWKNEVQLSSLEQ